MAGIPKGRILPSPLGMYFLRISFARYQPPFTLSTSVSTLFTKVSSYSYALSRSTPAAAFLLTNVQLQSKNSTVSKFIRFRNLWVRSCPALLAIPLSDDCMDAGGRATQEQLPRLASYAPVLHVRYVFPLRATQLCTSLPHVNGPTVSEYYQCV